MTVLPAHAHAATWPPTPRPEVDGVVEPLVDLASGAVVGGELLLRPRHFTSISRWRRSVPAAAHIDLAAVALERAGAELASRVGVLHVNLTPVDLEHPGIVEVVERSVPAVHRDRLIVEVTEELPVRNRATVRGAVAALRSLGLRFALDDFGEGWSNFAAVQLFAPEVLKVTASVVGPHLEPDFAPAIVGLARSLGAITVLERIEDEATATWALDAGFDLGQGWRWS